MIYGEGNADRELLRTIPIPSREGGVSNRWQGIQHGELADAVVQVAEQTGCEIVKETWQVGNKEGNLWGALDMRIPGENNLTIPGEGMLFALGVRHSNLGQFALSFAVGGRVAVCQNGMFTGDFVLTRKHTIGVNLQVTVEQGFHRYLGEAHSVENLVNRMQAFPMDNRSQEHLLLEAGRQEVFPWNKLEDVDNLWRNPEFPEFKERNAWSLYNCFTQVTREFVPHRQLNVLAGLKALFNNVLPNDLPVPSSN